MKTASNKRCLALADETDAEEEAARERELESELGDAEREEMDGASVDTIDDEDDDAEVNERRRACTNSTASSPSAATSNRQP